MSIDETIASLKIRRNQANGGVCCEFSYDGKEYYADLAFTSDHGNECMIFYRGEWADLYAKTGIPVTKDQLKECIAEFLKSL